jgi:uncharacterized protein (TIGR02231 family)
MQELETTIQQVTVFTRDARITRHGTAELEAGAHTLVIPALTTALYPDSVRVSGRGAGVQLLGVDVRREEYVDTPEEAIAELEERQKRLREEHAALTDEHTLIERRQAWLEDFGQQAAESLARWVGRGKVNLGDVSEVGAYLSHEDSDLYERRRQLTAELDHITAEVEAIERQLKRLRRGDRMTRYAVQVEVEAGQAAALELDLVYNVRGASWQPLYDIRLEGDDVTLTYMASITQNTGEEWPDVALSLSTARPALSTTIPELNPWPLREHQPPQPRPAAKRARGPAPAMMQAMTSGAAEADFAMAADEAEEAPRMEVQQAAVEQGTSITYHIPTAVWVAADGSEHKTTVTIEGFEAALDYVVVPKLAEEAYLRATVTNSGEYLILPGQASIYHEADYVGKTRLVTTAPGEEFEVQLGVDDRLRVDREMTAHDVSKPTLTNKRRIEYAYAITLSNHSGRETRVTVKDHIPYSTHENIDVKLSSADPTPQENTDLNILTWELPLEAGAEAVVSYAFLVEHPRTMRVVGL